MAQLHSLLMLARLCSKSFKSCFNSTWTGNFQMYKLGTEEAEEPEIKFSTSSDQWSSSRYFSETPLLFLWSGGCWHLISGFTASSKFSLYIWKFSAHVLLKPSLKDFEHNLASMWNDCNCMVIWTFFGIALLWDCNENWPFPVLWPLLVFQICWHIECSTLTTSSFRIWNSSAGIATAPLALFVVMLPKVHLTSHSRMSGSRWVITPSWLSGLWRFFCIVLLCILATSS